MASSFHSQWRWANTLTSAAHSSISGGWALLVIMWTHPGSLIICCYLCSFELHGFALKLYLCFKIKSASLNWGLGWTWPSLKLVKLTWNSHISSRGLHDSLILNLTLAFIIDWIVVSNEHSFIPKPLVSLGLVSLEQCLALKVTLSFVNLPLSRAPWRRDHWIRRLCPQAVLSLSRILRIRLHRYGTLHMA